MSVTISDLPPASSLTGSEYLAVDQAQTVKAAVSNLPQGMSAGVVVYGGTGGTPFPNYRTLTAGSNVTISDAGAQGALTISAAEIAGSATVTSTGATVARTISNHFNDQLYAKDFGAVGDGVTDDTAAIQLALDTLRSDYPDGAMLLFERGTYVASQITIYRNQILKSSDGVQACTLLQKASSNKDFIISENFAALTGTGANYGTNPLVPSWFGMQDMHINGNAAAQSAGNWRAIAWYGNAQLMLGTNFIQSAKQDNIYTEASGLGAYSATDWLAEEEGFFENVISFNAGRYGWLNRGPHDSVIVSYIGRQNASTGYRSEESGTTYTGTAHIHTIHTYAETDFTGQYYGASSTVNEAYTDFDNITLASQGNTIDKLYQIQIGYGGLNGCEVTAPYNTIGVHIMNFYQPATNVIGCNIQSGGGNFAVGCANSTAVPATSGITLYKIRANFCSISGIFSNAVGAGSIGIDLNAAFCRIVGCSYGNTLALKYVAGNDNYVQLYDYSAAGATATLSGTQDPSDTFNITSDRGFNNVGPGYSFTSAFDGNGNIFWYITSSMSGYYLPGYQTQTTQKGAEANDAYSYQTPSTGFSITIDLSVSYLILNPSGTLSTGTITMPYAPVNGQKAFISSSQIITTLTVSPNSGQTLKNAITTLAAGGTAGWMYRAGDTTWYRIQ